MPNIQQRRVDDDSDAFDERGMLKDGRSTRVRMMMRDGASIDGATAEDKFWDGFMKAKEQMAQDARAEMVRTMCDAWKTDASPPTGVGSHGNYEPAEGSACMDDDTHSPGVYVREGGKLVCRAVKKDAASTTDAAKGRQTIDSAYQAMVEERQNAWKNP